MERKYYLEQLQLYLQESPVVALLGPRQCGKTTLARQYISHSKENHETYFFDLEDPLHLAALQTPKLTLDQLSGLIIIDEIQRIPNLFTYLRVLVDRPENRIQFLILGSASRDLIRQSSETLAGRIAYLELTPFNMQETKDQNKLWLRGGFPRSYLASNEPASFRWRKNYINTFLERDIPNLGITIPSITLRRFWMMLTHYHGNIFNASEIAMAMGVSSTTIKRYLDILTGAFMIRQLTPWIANLKKRQIKSTKIYLRDSGILFALKGVKNTQELLLDPALGAYWEGFALEEIIRYHHADPEDCYFWATQNRAEL
ncbi:MAG: ATP-binding protein, partial [Gammaproteobacteria bacterium]